MKNVYSVGQVNYYIKNMFAQDFMLKRIYVKGEISNCKYHSSGHIYFTLKDEKGAISCIMFAGQRKSLSFRMQEGQNVIVLGSIQAYERDGTYQLYANEVVLEGAGRLYEQFEKLKRELEEMGMFSPEYKKPIPAFSRRIGIVTAPTGAAIQDIRNIAGRRNPYVQLILYPALVQGEQAADSIVKGIQMLDAQNLDVLIVGRGGGSIEDLWAFNEEKVARAIFQCETPVISAVGHETDVTIADYVADLRAPTPSAAAELAVFDWNLFLGQQEVYKRRIQESIYGKLQLYKRELKNYELRLENQSPMAKLIEKRTLAMSLETELNQKMKDHYRDRRFRFQMYLERLEGLSPLKKLSQGYSFVADKEGKTVTSTVQVQPEDSVYIHVTDGRIRAVVKEIETICRR